MKRVLPSTSYTAVQSRSNPILYDNLVSAVIFLIQCEEGQNPHRQKGPSRVITSACVGGCKCGRAGVRSFLPCIRDSREEMSLKASQINGDEQNRAPCDAKEMDVGDGV